MSFRTICLGGVTLTLAACATLGRMIQPPVFSAAPDRTAELRVLPPTIARPLGGASIRMWARVQNPNPFGLTLSHLAGNLLLEGERAADLDLPLGLPIPAQRDTVFPLDLTISLADLPDLAGALRDAIGRNQVAYRVVGTATVNGGPIGDADFGPYTLLNGQLRIVR